jgi:hypothetical protein
MPLSPSERSQRARIGALNLRAQRDPAEYTSSARSAFLTRFARQVDPDEVLDPKERELRAAAALRAHMALLAFRSARSRSRAHRHQSA